MPSFTQAAQFWGPELVGRGGGRTVKPAMEGGRPAASPTQAHATARALEPLSATGVASRHDAPCETLGAQPQTPACLNATRADGCQDQGLLSSC